jgi:hypothetical protein
MVAQNLDSTRRSVRAPRITDYESCEWPCRTRKSTPERVLGAGPGMGAARTSYPHNLFVRLRVSGTPDVRPALVEAIRNQFLAGATRLFIDVEELSMNPTTGLELFEQIETLRAEFDALIIWSRDPLDAIEGSTRVFGFGNTPMNVDGDRPVASRDTSRNARPTVRKTRTFVPLPSIQWRRLRTRGDLRRQT